jgi:hypothetical protein
MKHSGAQVRAWSDQLSQNAHEPKNMARAPSFRTPEQELFQNAQDHKELVGSPLSEPLIILSLAKSFTKMFIQ